jgi:hypothetical protein
MKNRAAARTRKLIYGVSIGGLPLQVAKTQQRKHFNTKLNGYQSKKTSKKTVLRTNLCFYRVAV